VVTILQKSQQMLHLCRSITTQNFGILHLHCHYVDTINGRKLKSNNRDSVAFSGIMSIPSFMKFDLLVNTLTFIVHIYSCTLQGQAS